MAEQACKFEEIVVSDLFDGVLRNLTDEEQLELEHEIADYDFTIYSPLIVWENDGKYILVDGHHRRAILERNIKDGHIQPTDVPIELFEFMGEADVVRWIKKNQMARRNLSEREKSLLRGRQANVKSGYNQHSAKKLDENKEVGNEGGGTLPPPERTKEEVASEHNVSTDTIKRDKKFTAAMEVIKEHVDPKIFKQLLSDKCPISRKRLEMIATEVKPDRIEFAIKSGLGILEDEEDFDNFQIDEEMTEEDLEKVQHEDWLKRAKELDKIIGRALTLMQCDEMSNGGREAAAQMLAQHAGWLAQCWKRYLLNKPYITGSDPQYVSRNDSEIFMLRSVRAKELKITVDDRLEKLPFNSTMSQCLLKPGK